MKAMSKPRKILQITSYPPPSAGWGMRVQFLKRRLEADGHRCVVLNIGTSRRIPSDEYQTIMSGLDYLRKVWRYSAAGYVAHVHVNGASAKGFLLAITAEVVNLLCGRRCFLTFHAGIDQVYFPRPKYPFLLPVFWLLFAIPRHIICNSEAVKEKIRAYGVPAGKIVPIPAFSEQYMGYTSVELPSELEAFYQRFDTILFSYIRVRPLFYPVALVDGFATLAKKRHDVGLVVCGVSGHMEQGLWREVRDRIGRDGLDSRICVVDDLDHDEFLTALSRASVYVRTHVSDGVCSSVLEALALRVPVVASENGTRPQGVITYPSSDADRLAAVLEDVLDRHPALVRALVRPELLDTVGDEARLLTA